MLIVRVSSNENGVGAYMNESVWSSSLVGTIKRKKEESGPTLEETRPDHAIRNSVAITKLPLGHDMLKKRKKKNNNKKE